MMGSSIVVAIFLAIGLSSAIEANHRREPVPAIDEPTFSAISWEPETLTGDWHFSQSPTPKVISETTICTQKCVIITLPASTASTTSLWTSAAAGPPVSISCITIRDSTSEGPQPSTASSTSSLTAAGAPESSFASETYYDVTVTVTISSTTTVWRHTTLAGTESRNPSSVVASSEELSTPCTTDITVTETLTKTKTWRSLVPVTSTLVRTRLTTMTTALIEPYSTSTGDSTQTVILETTETINTVSIKTECSSPREDCGEVSAAHSVSAAGSKAAAFDTSCTTTSTDSVASQGYSQPPVYLSTSVVSASWVTSTKASFVPSRVSATRVLSSSDSGDEQSDSRTLKDGATSVSTAGGVAVTAGLGMGALVGIIVAMA